MAPRQLARPLTLIWVANARSPLAQCLLRNSKEKSETSYFPVNKSSKDWATLVSQPSICGHSHVLTPPSPKSQCIKQHTFFFSFCFHFFIYLPISLIISLPLLTIAFLQRFSHVFPYIPCPFFGPNPCISMTVQIMKYLP